jgi:hypothetical protein
MTDFDEAVRRNLENDWGPAALHSDFKMGDTLRYQADGSTWSGIIVWVTGPSESHVEGRDPLSLRYIVECSGWSGFPDVVYSADIVSQQESL